MKWGYLIPRLLVVLVLWAIVQFGFDPSLRIAGQMSLAGSTGRSVKLDGVKTQFWPPRFEAAHLEVAEAESLDQAEWTAETIRVEIDEKALRQRRWIAEEVAVEGVAWNVPSEFEADAPADENDSDSGWTDGLKERSRRALEDQLDAIQERVAGQLDAERFETVRLAKTKRGEYDQSIGDLRQRVERLRVQAEQYRQLVESPEARRSLLLNPKRVEQLAKQAKTVEADIRSVRDEVRLLKDRVPVDYRELDAAKDRDLATAKADWNEFTSGPDQMVDLLLGGPVADALDHLVVWWPRWQKFRASGDWKRRHEAERRGRTIHFLPEQAGPIAGVRLLTMSGVANRGEQRVPFQCEMGDLTYPPIPDKPASFRWASDGEVELQAAGLVRLHNNEPEMTLQFRMHEKSVIQSRQALGSSAMVAFASEPTIVEGTLTLGKSVQGNCRFEFPSAKAAVRTGQAQYDTLLSALDVDAASLSPTLKFEVGSGHRNFDLKCDGLDGVTDRWSNQLTSLGRQQAAALQARAEAYLGSEIQSVVKNSAEIDQLLSAIPTLNANQFARGNLLPKDFVPESIQRTAGERVTEKASGFLNRILR